MQNKNGELIDNDKEICNLLAKYFNSVYTPMSYDKMPEMNNMYESEIRDIEITREDIQSRLERLKVIKLCGPDNLHLFVLQKTASVTCVPLEKIFRKINKFRRMSNRLEECKCSTYT